jgi:hypothetical protein
MKSEKSTDICQDISTVVVGCRHDPKSIRVPLGARSSWRPGALTVRKATRHALLIYHANPNELRAITKNEGEWEKHGHGQSPFYRIDTRCTVTNHAVTSVLEHGCFTT